MTLRACLAIVLLGACASALAPARSPDGAPKTAPSATPPPATPPPVPASRAPAPPRAPASYAAISDALSAAALGELFTKSFALHTAGGRTFERVTTGGTWTAIAVDEDHARIQVRVELVGATVVGSIAADEALDVVARDAGITPTPDVPPPVAGGIGVFIEPGYVVWSPARDGYRPVQFLLRRDYIGVEGWISETRVGKIFEPPPPHVATPPPGNGWKLVNPGRVAFWDQPDGGRVIATVQTCALWTRPVEGGGGATVEAFDREAGRAVRGYLKDLHVRAEPPCDPAGGAMYLQVPDPTPTPNGTPIPAGACVYDARAGTAIGALSAKDVRGDFDEDGWARVDAKDMFTTFPLWAHRDRAGAIERCAR